jgi:hypothetical protein
MFANLMFQEIRQRCLGVVLEFLIIFNILPLEVLTNFNILYLIYEEFDHRVKYLQGINF